MGKKHVKRDISCMLLQTVKCKGTIKKVQTKPKNKNKKIKITLCQPQLNFKKQPMQRERGVALILTKHSLHRRRKHSWAFPSKKSRTNNETRKWVGDNKSQTVTLILSLHPKHLLRWQSLAGHLPVLTNNDTDVWTFALKHVLVWASYCKLHWKFSWP